MDVRVGNSPIPAGTGSITLNTRCAYQQQAALPNSVVSFECPAPGIVGNTVSLQNGVYNLELLEIEPLGKFFNVRAVGRAVASDTRGPQFESRHRHNFIYVQDEYLSRFLS